jgi:hypothetical protein
MLGSAASPRVCTVVRKCLTERNILVELAPGVDKLPSCRSGCREQAECRQGECLRRHGRWITCIATMTVRHTCNVARPQPDDTDAAHEVALMLDTVRDKAVAGTTAAAGRP